MCSAGCTTLYNFYKLQQHKLISCSVDSAAIKPHGAPQLLIS